MGKYLTKRILFAIFSLLVVITVVMLLVYTLTNRSAIFQQDDMWNKKNGNDRVYYEYMQYQNYGYLNFVNYSNFLVDKYKTLLGDDYSADSAFIADRNAIKYPKTFLDNPRLRSFTKNMKQREDK